MGGMGMHHPSETTVGMEDHTDNMHMEHATTAHIPMQHTTQGMAHDDSTTEAPMHHATPQSGMAMMDHDKTTVGMGMHHETTTSDNDQEEALDEIGNMVHGTTQAMMHHEGATTTDSVTIADDAADALAEMDQMDPHSSDSTTASSVVTEAATEAATTADAEI